MIKAIVYTSNTGFTREYALILGDKLNLPVYTLKEAKLSLELKEEIIYLGWLCANRIMGLNKAQKSYNILAVGAVGARLPYDNEYLEALKHNNSRANNLYYLHGGIDYQSLKGVKKWILKESGKFIAKGNTKEALQMQKIFTNGGSFVDEKYLEPIIKLVEALKE